MKFTLTQLPKITTILSLLIFFLFAGYSLALAQYPEEAFPQTSTCANFTSCLRDIVTPGLSQRFSQQGLPSQLVTVILPLILVAAGFFTAIVIAYSGFKFVTSSGNPEAATSARNRLVWAIAGFVIVILSFAILQIFDTLVLKGSGII